jgi:hypothetical protein
MKVNLIIIHGLLERGIICPIKHLQLKQNESQSYHNVWLLERGKTERKNNKRFERWRGKGDKKREDDKR